MAKQPSTMSDWAFNDHEPFSEYSLSSTRTSPASSTPYNLDGDASDMISASHPPFSPSSLPACSPNFMHLPHQNPNQLSVFPPHAWSPSYDGSGSSGANTPTTGELTTRSTVASSDRSRQSSYASTSFRRASQSVDFIPNVFDLSPIAVEDTLSTPPTQFVDSNESDCSQFPYVFPIHEDVKPSSLPFALGVSASSMQTHEDLVEDMKRSNSHQSNSSGVSTQSRASQRRQETLAQSSRPIAPKEAALNMTLMSRQASSHQMTLASSQEGEGSSKSVAAITKAPVKTYVRPKHPKIQCPHCSLYPDGFRGEHELRRHVDSKHTAVKKVWICVDVSPNQTFLTSCKQCRNKKQYGAYYNAAAHLRRAHFHPRKRGRKSRNDSEKRGGKGGGNDPPMDELKKWMKEIEVVATRDDANDVADAVDSSSENDVETAVSVMPAAHDPSNMLVDTAPSMYQSPVAMPTQGYMPAPFVQQSTPFFGIDNLPANFDLNYQLPINGGISCPPPASSFDMQPQFDGTYSEPFPYDMTQQ